MQQLKWLTMTAAVLGTAACQTMSPGEAGNLVPKTVAEDPSLPAIDMNGSRFHLQTMGNPANPAIVFLHGGPGGDYRSMLRMAELADSYYLVFWDQRGAGLSMRHGRTLLTIDTYLADLDSLVERYSPGRPVYLIGVSWGGMYATAYINEHPGRVAGAVLIEPGPLDGSTAERLKDDIVDFDLGAEWLNDMVWSSQFLGSDDHARMDYERLLGVRDAQPRFHLSKADPEMGWRLGAAASKYIMEDGQDGHGHFNYDFTTHLSAYATPVLFVAGSMSEVLGESLQQIQVHRYPSASLEVVQGAGHDVAWVKAAEVVALIRGYLTEREGGAR
ncbi:MAG TPA: alpha/beta hydrolase [Gemmatimonadales bacterium]|nr:alpha/beta hydrolase [Gemmatimonadales bacterium]